MPGAPGVACWQVSGVTGSAGFPEGIGLVYFPATAGAFPPVSGG